MECSSQGMKHPTMQYISQYLCKQKANKCRNPLHRHYIEALHRGRGTTHTPWPRKVSPQLFCQQGYCAHRPQAACSNLQERCCKHITQTSRNTIKNHQYNINILHKPLTQLFVSSWVSRHNHETNRDDEIPCMYITINTIVYAWTCQTVKTEELEQ